MKRSGNFLFGLLLFMGAALAQPAGFQPGSRVLANPTGNGAYPAQVVRYNPDSETYLIRFTSGPYAIGKGEYTLSPSRLQPAPVAPTPPAAGVAANSPPDTQPKSTPPPNARPQQEKAQESTWESIWRQREATIRAQQQNAGKPVGKVAGSTPFQGLYLRHEQSFQGTALNYREDHYYFFPDGRVYHDVPPEGPKLFDWSKAQQASPELCGYYGIKGNEITFSWSDGSYTWMLKPNGGGYEMNYSPTVKVDAFGPNALLAGTYQRGDVTVAAGTPSLSTAFSYTFQPDGTVYINEMKGTDSTHLTTTVRERNRGTYRLSGNDLEVRTAIGEVWRCTAYPQWDKASSGQKPSRLSLDGALLELKR